MKDNLSPLTTACHLSNSQPELGLFIQEKICCILPNSNRK